MQERFLKVEHIKQNQETQSANLEDVASTNGQNAFKVYPINNKRVSGFRCSAPVAL